MNLFPFQLALDLTVCHPYDKKELLSLECQSQARILIDRWPDWPIPFVCFVGEKRSGKTHLAHLWKEKGNAKYITPSTLQEPDVLINNRRPIIIDDADQIDDNYWLFHFYNLAKEKQLHILFCAESAPAQWMFVTLPDLKSRLSTILCATINALDDTSLTCMLIHSLKEQGLTITRDATDFLIKRIDRSFDSIHQLARTIHYYALAHQKHQVTLPMVRLILRGMEEENED